MTEYRFSLASSLFGLAQPLDWPPAMPEPIRPRVVATAMSGRKKMGGLEGRRLSWPFMPTEQWSYLMQLTGGVYGGGRAGFIRCQALDPAMVSTVNRWADYACIIDVPNGGRPRGPDTVWAAQLEVTRMLFVRWSV